MKVDIPILWSWSKGAPIIWKTHGVDSSKMSSNFCKFLLVNDAVEFQLEAALSALSGCDILRVLASRNHDMELLVILFVKERTDADCPHWLLKVYYSNYVKVPRV